MDRTSRRACADFSRSLCSAGERGAVIILSIPDEPITQGTLRQTSVMLYSPSRKAETVSTLCSFRMIAAEIRTRDNPMA